MSYHHFSTFERGRIQEVLPLGYSHRGIAQKLNRHRSSVDREVRRNTADTAYVAEGAQGAYSTQDPGQNSSLYGKCNYHALRYIA